MFVERARHIPRLTRLALGGSVAVIVTACSLTMNLDAQQCSVDADCVARGAGFEGTVCVNRVCVAPVTSDASVDAPSEDAATDGGKCTERRVSPDPSKQVKIEMPVVRLATGEPMSGATIKLCSRIDVNCTNPREANLIPDPTTGIVTATVESGFNGYFEITGEGLQSSIMMVDPPAYEDRRIVTWQVLQSVTFNILAQTAGVTHEPSPDLGHILVGTRDCAYTAPVEGIRFQVDKVDPDGRTTGFYINGGLPESGRTATAKDGSGGYINLVPGFVEVTAFDQATNTKFSSATLIIRKGFLSYALLLPSD